VLFFRIFPDFGEFFRNFKFFSFVGVLGGKAERFFPSGGGRPGRPERLPKAAFWPGGGPQAKKKSPRRGPKSPQTGELRDFFNDFGRLGAQKKF
jgi:hypothetical protein